MTAIRYGYSRKPARDIVPGDLVAPARGAIRRIAQAEHWQRWDGADMVTLIDTNGRGFAAREASWLYRVEHQLEAV